MFTFNKSLVLVVCCWLSFLAAPGFTQSTDVTPAEEVIPTEIVDEPAEQPNDSNETIPLVAEAGPDKNVAIGRNVLFDASASTGPNETNLTYVWDFGDGQQFQGIDASHIYQEPGTYKAKLTVSDGKQIARDTVLVSVAKDVVLMIVDDSISRDTIRYYKQYAQRNDTLLVTMRPQHESTLDYVLSRSLAEQLIAQQDNISQASIIVVWTEKNIGLDALRAVGQIVSSSEAAAQTDFSFNQKAIIRIADRQASGALARLAQNTYNTINPSYVLLTTTSALEIILASPDIDSLTDKLNEQQVSYKLIGRYSQRALEKISPLNFLSYGINYLLNQGVTQDTLFLLLILPVVATLVSFGRQVVGVKAFGIYIPSLMTLTFVVTGLRYGIIIFAVLLATATLARLAVRRLHLLYMPRMAIVLSVVSLSIFGMFLGAHYLNQDAFLSLSIFPILVMIILTEKFVEVQIEQGDRTAVFLTLETLALTMVCYLIVTWEAFETVVLAYPEVILLTILINIALGRFSGLRIVEYFRFRKLIKPTK